MSESIQIEIRFEPSAAVTLAEIALLESILPEIILAMMQAEVLLVDD